MLLFLIKFLKWIDKIDLLQSNIMINKTWVQFVVQTAILRKNDD